MNIALAAGGGAPCAPARIIALAGLLAASQRLLARGWPPPPVSVFTAIDGLAIDGGKRRTVNHLGPLRRVHELDRDSAAMIDVGTPEMVIVRWDQRASLAEGPV